MCKSDENALGQATDRYLGSTTGVIRQKYSYPASANFRLTALQSGVSPTYTNLQNIGYSYDAVGNVASIVDVANSSQRQCYSYDALHRLTRGFTTGATTCNNNPNTVGSGPFDETTTYQDVLGGRGGNLTSKTGVGNYTYGVAQAADCPEGALVKANAVVAAGSNYLFYCYDQNGSLRRRKVGSNITATYGYDAENRLTSVSGAAAASFVYDGDGNRVKTTFGSTTTVYVGNIYERDNGSTVRKYYYAGGVRVAMRTGGQIYYLLGDHLGGTNVTANSSGVQISKLLYRPWGETRFSSGTTPTTWRFTGQREDATIGLYYFNARYLDPQLGRFTQADTIVPEPGDPQALNRYSYANNNPVKFTDPSGHCPICVTAGVGFLGGVIISAGSQFIGGLSQGLSVDQAFHQIDAGKVVAAGLAGGVAGLTFGIGTAVLGTGIIATGISGAAAGVVEGRMGVIADSTWNEVERWKSGQSFETRRLWDEAVTNGLIDPMSMAIDAGSGAITANLGRQFGNWLMDQGIMVRSTATTRSASVPTIRLLPNGGITLELGRQPLQLSQDVWDGIIAALMEGNAALAEELLSKSMDEALHGIANPGGNP
jgi:RHS repeat-associated protein